MKKYVILAVLFFTFLSGYAQIPIDSASYYLKSGKHIKSALEGNINGVWVCKNPDNSFAINIKKGVRHYQMDSTINFTVDNLMISVNKLIVNGHDLSSQFKNNNIDLGISFNSPKEFFGNYTDPVTKNRVVITLKQISDKSLSLTVTFPEFGLSKTVLPRFSTFSR